MSGLSTTILDWCFPPRAEELLVRSLAREDLSPTPYYPTPDITCLLPFNHPRIQALIHEAKFFYNRRAHHLLGDVLHTHLATYTAPYRLIPLPLHPRRQRARGFNQVQACLATQPALRQVTHQQLLKRIRYTTPQTHLSAAKRVENMTDAFAVTRRKQSPISSDIQLLVIDDVYTTGATMHSALTALRTTYSNPIRGITFSYA